MQFAKTAFLGRRNNLETFFARRSQSSPPRIRKGFPSDKPPGFRELAASGWSAISASEAPVRGRQIIAQGASPGFATIDVRRLVPEGRQSHNGALLCRPLSGA